MKEQETVTSEEPEGAVTLQAVRVEEPAPAQEQEPVQTPAPNSGAITDHLKSVEHSLLQRLEAAGLSHHQKLDSIAKSIDARFDSLAESFDLKHREGIRGIALTVSSEIETVKDSISELLSEVRSLAVAVSTVKIHE